MGSIQNRQLCFRGVSKELCYRDLYAKGSIIVPLYAGRLRSVLQWNLFIKDTLNLGHHSNEDSAYSPNYIELCKNLPLNQRHLSIQDSQLGPSGIHYREVPLYVQNAVQWLCSMYSQSDSSSLPEGVCGLPMRGAKGKISKGQGLGFVCG